jgi:hypothetical protein
MRSNPIRIDAMKSKRAIAAGMVILLSAGTSSALVAPLETARPRLAAPNLIVVHGRGLDRPVLLKDWDENLRLMLGLVTLEEAEKSSVMRGLMKLGLVSIDTVRRKSFEVALFWAPVVARLRARGLPMEQWPVEEADQHARFFPSAARDSALWVWVASPLGGGVGARRLEPAALAILSRHGVPTTTR